MYRNHNKLMVAVAFLLSLALAITLTPDLDVYAQDSVTDVDDETPVAMVGDQSFTSLQEAVDATTGDILITINKDIVGTSTTNPSEIWTMLTIPSNRTATVSQSRGLSFMTEGSSGAFPASSSGEAGA